MGACIVFPSTKYLMVKMLKRSGDCETAIGFLSLSASAQIGFFHWFSVITSP